jgi:hypothetical protein
MHHLIQRCIYRATAALLNKQYWLPHAWNVEYIAGTLNGTLAGLSKQKQKPLLCDENMRDYRVIPLFDKSHFPPCVWAVG